MSFVFTPRYLSELHQGSAGNIATATLKAVLAVSGYTFDEDAIETYALFTAISPSAELATGNGYTVGGQAFANPDTTNVQDETNGRSDIGWDNVVWNASGGNIGPSAGVLVYIDSHASDIVIGYEAFAQDLTAFDGNPFTLSNLLSRIAGA